MREYTGIHRADCFFRFRGCWRSGGGGSIEDDEESNNPLLSPRVVGGLGERVPEGARGTFMVPEFAYFLRADGFIALIELKFTSI